jgi:hypothetical protein
MSRPIPPPVFLLKAYAIKQHGEKFYVAQSAVVDKQEWSKGSFPAGRMCRDRPQACRRVDRAQCATPQVPSLGQGALIMDDAQLAMTHLLREADELALEVRYQHLGRINAWFDGLTIEQKRQLGSFMSEAEWETCASLSVCACDFHRSNRK